jgi:hypothetical protein
MAQGIASLHKILKDETRRKILLVIEERGNITYTDLMNAVGIQSTGKLNYHLKILNGLVSKENSQYSLTEKGKLAIRLLEEFCLKKSQSEIEAPFPKGYFITVGIFSIVLLSLVFGFYIAGVITLERFILYIATSILGILFLVLAEKARTRRAMMKPTSQMLGAKLSIIFAGAFAGGVILFFVGGFLIGFMAKSLGFSLFSFTYWIVISFVVGSFVGGLVGYFIYKRSKFSKITYYSPFAE